MTNKKDQDIIDFYEWCNYPIYRPKGNMGFQKRVIPQFPEYNTYQVIDETGYSVLPEGKYLTTQELLEYYKQHK